MANTIEYWYDETVSAAANVASSYASTQALENDAAYTAGNYAGIERSPTTAWRSWRDNIVFTGESIANSVPAQGAFVEALNREMVNTIADMRIREQDARWFPRTYYLRGKPWETWPKQEVINGKLRDIDPDLLVDEGL